MRLATITAGLAGAAVLAVIGAPSAHAQTNNNQIKAAAKQTQTVAVADGDTLTSIADTYQTTYVRIFDANTSISDPNLIYVGDNLRIPTTDEQLTEREIPAAYVAANPIQTNQSVNQTQPVAAYQPAAAPTGTVTAGCGDNTYANYIYSHESGCRTTAMSPNGCYGIGQACPASKLAYCGADYTCQNAFFTAYADKYGGWAGAYSFWISHGWW